MVDLVLFVALLLVIGAVAFVVYLLSQANGSHAAMSKEEKKELLELRRVVREVDALAFQYRNSHPELSFLITDKIARSKSKELY